MKHNTLLAVAGAVALGATGFAHAGTVSDQGHVNVTVEGTCEMLPDQDKFFDLGQATAAQLGFMVTVRCSDQLPYILENDTAQQGRLQVVDANTSRAYDVYFTRTDSGSYWGSTLNGEQLNDVGTGVYQSHGMSVSFNMNSAYGRPQAGLYVGSYTNTLSF